MNMNADLEINREQEIAKYFESVGFLLGGLSHFFQHLEKSALYQNLTETRNIRKSQWVKNRILPPFMDNVFRHVRLNDEVTKEHLNRIITTEFEMTYEEADRGNYTILIFLNESKGYKHLSYIGKKKGDDKK